MLDPMMLPRAISVFFLSAAVIDAASSGREVPQAIRVMEMAASLMFHALAIFIALSTKKSQLVTRIARPPTTLSMAIHTDPVCAWISSGFVSCFFCPLNDLHIYQAKIPISISPSILPTTATLPLKKLNANNIRSTERKMQRGMSNFRFALSILIGKHIAVAPRIPRTLKIFDPTTFPRATSELPRTAPMRLTISSGADVPTPTIAAPITKSDTLKRLAIWTDPLTSQSAPNTMPTSDTIKIKYSIIYL